MEAHNHPVDPDRVAAVRTLGLPADEARVLAAMLTLLADPLRARLVAALTAVEEVCVGDLALALDTREDAVTYGLRLLRTAGLVSRRREGRMGYYRLSDDGLRPVLAAALTHLRQLGSFHPEATADGGER